MEKLNVAVFLCNIYMLCTHGYEQWQISFVVTCPNINSVHVL